MKETASVCCHIACFEHKEIDERVLEGKEIYVVLYGNELLTFISMLSRSTPFCLVILPEV